MKRLLLPPLILLGGVGLSHSLQSKSLQTWTDNKGLVMIFRNLRAITGTKTERDISMVGQVDATSTSQGLKITSDRMDIHAVPDIKNPKAYVVQHAVAKGHVKIVKQVVAKEGNQETQIEGSQADLTSGAAESVVKIAGPVTMKSLDGKHVQTMLATGNSGVATLESKGNGSLENGLREAKLDGSTHLVINQIDSKTHKSTTIRTSSDHVRLQNKGTDRVITLTGAVHIFGDLTGDNKGSDSVVFTISKDGDFKINSGLDK